MKRLLFLLLPTVLLASCGSEPPASVKKRVSTVPAAVGVVSSGDAVSATVVGENVAELAFKAPGRIAEILVKVGDRVEKGQLLARLSNAEGAIQSGGYAEIVSGLSDMRRSVESLYESRANIAEADVANAKTRVALAEKDLELARTNLENTRAVLSGSVVSAAERGIQAEKSLALSKTQLANTEKLLDEQASSLREWALAAMANAFVVARTGRDFADEILGVTETNRHKNDAYETYLGAKNAATVDAAKSRFGTFDAKYSQTYDWYYANVSGKDAVSMETAKEGLARATETLRSEREALHALRNAFENTVADVRALPQSDLDALKSKADGILSGIETSILSPNSGGTDGALRAIESFERDRELKVSSLEDSVKLAESGLELAKTGRILAGSDEKKNLDALSLAVEMKARELELAKKEAAKATESVGTLAREADAKVAEIETKISEGAMAGRLAVEAAASAELRAPYSGIVLERRFDPGAVVGAGTPVLSVSEAGELKAAFDFDSKTTPLSEGEAVSVRSGKTGKTFTGILVSVAATDSLESAKRRAEVRIPSGEAEIGDRVTVRPGSAVPASPSGVVVPVSSIVTRYSFPSVFVLQNGVARLKTVRISASDGTFVQVEGISAGEAVVTDGKDSVLDGERVE